MSKKINIGDLVAQSMLEITKSDVHKGIFKKAEAATIVENDSVSDEQLTNLSELITSVAELGDFLDDMGFQKSASAALFTLETLISEAAKKKEKKELPEFLKEKIKDKDKDKDKDKKPKKKETKQEMKERMADLRKMKKDASFY